MEIYRNSNDRTLTLDVPVEATGNNIDVTIYRDGKEIFVVDTIAYINGQYVVELPFFVVQNEGDYSINWYFLYRENGQAHEYNEFEEFSVVTPILPLKEIKKIIESDDDDEAREIERAVRYIIQAHTGQSFGKFVGTKSVTGSGENNLRLPGRLILINSINGSSYFVNSLNIRGNGWYLQSLSRGIPTIRADWDGWNEATAHTSRVPIGAPSQRALVAFERHVEYSIEGVWGWNSIPPAVSEAAKLLVNDYACSDSVYRDRFVNSIKAADWSMQFHDGAYIDTGNVRANQLLNEYVLKRGWMVL